MSDKPEQKKPFFSCCSAEEERKEALVEVFEKRPVLQLQPTSTINHISNIVYQPQPVRFSASVQIVPIPQQNYQTNSKFRFTYQNPTIIK